jgi:hypothetical protein
MNMNDTMATMYMNDTMYMYSSDMDMGGMMMHMTYYWGSDVTVWFDGWTTSDNLTYIATLLFLLCLSIFTEFWSGITIRCRNLTL